MSIININLPFSIEYINGLRCEILRDFVFSNQLVIHKLVLVSPIKGNKYLKSLHISCNPFFTVQLFDHKRASSQSPELSLAFSNQSLWFHDIIENDKAILATQWEMHATPQNMLCLVLKKAITVGHSKKLPVDLCFEYLDQNINTMEVEPLNPIKAAFDPELGTLTIDPLEILCAVFLDSSIQHRAGHISCQLTETNFCFKYGEDVPAPKPLEFKPGRVIQSGRFFIPPSKKSADTPYKTSSDDAPQMFRISEMDMRCHAIKRVHRYVEQGTKITLELAQKALQEAADKLDQGIKMCLLYMIHQWAPELDEDLKLEVLYAAAGDFPSPYPLSILKSTYKAQNNYSMLLSLLQRQITNNMLAPKRRIPLEIEYCLLLSGPLDLGQIAIKKLDSLKQLVLTYALPDERIEYAMAYHKSQCTVRAIQYLREWMKTSSSPKDITSFGLKLARLMFEHNDPIQSIVDVCSRVLEVSPQNIEALEIMAHCLEKANRNEDATVVWQECFEQFMHTWEMARIKAGINPSEENIKWLQTCHMKAVEATTTLERLLTGDARAPMRSLIYHAHLRLEPNSIIVLSGFLEDLEMTRSYYQMVQVCQEFLKKNEKNIEPTHEISIRLTLHNIYDCELNRPEEALKQLNRAREIAALDPRVISTEIERYRRRGLKQEQVGLRLSLIENLPSNEIIEPTLELVRLYEDINAPISEILDILRKTNARSPNHPQILLELRSYLRKTDQLFELSTVLEKLSRVITDLNTKKTILLESSEVNEKLGNHQVAQVLYHEAQLCNPINPDSKTDFLPQNIAPFSSDTASSNPSLTSIFLTSRSLPRVNSTERSEKISFELQAVDETQVSGEHRALSEFTRTLTTHVQRLHDLIQEPGTGKSKSEKSKVDQTLDKSDANAIISSDLPIETLINSARAQGNTNALLERLLLSIQDIPDAEKPPRVLQEIGCIYLYEKYDLYNARTYLEQASLLSEDIEFGEQTLNALEVIYSELNLYPELAGVYERKCAILTIEDECRKYEVRLAQLRYEKLDETVLAINTLEDIIDKYPNDELAIQQLAQIYIDIQDPIRAIETLERVTPLLKADSKEMAQHLLKLVALYNDINYTFKAKQIMHDLLKYNTHIDKLAVIELFKRTCREHDEWQELLYILNDEIAYYLNIPSDEFDIKVLLNSDNPKIASGYASHALREYADVLYKKIKKVEEAANIYFALIRIHPESDYPRNALFEIIEQYPDNSAVMKIIMTLANVEIMNTIVQPLMNSQDKETAESLNNDFKSVYNMIQKRTFKKADTALSKLESKITNFRTKYYTPLIVAFRQHSRALRDKDKD